MITERLKVPITDLEIDQPSLPSIRNHGISKPTFFCTDDKIIPIPTATPKLVNKRLVAIAIVIAKSGGTMLYQTIPT